MRQCATRLHRVAYLLTADSGQAEELTQNALARTYAAWRRIRNDDAYAYARRVLVNLHTDWWRARAGALQGLTRRERAVIVHRYFLDLTEQQTARELGVSVGTVKS